MVGVGPRGAAELRQAVGAGLAFDGRGPGGCSQTPAAASREREPRQWSGGGRRPVSASSSQRSPRLRVQASAHAAADAVLQERWGTSDDWHLSWMLC